MEFFNLLYLATGPGIALAIFLYYSDKWEPEPRWMVIKSFLLGGVAVFPSAYIEETLQTAYHLNDTAPGFGWEVLVNAFIVVALVEELFKVLLLKAFLYDDRQFNEPFDGIVYGGIMGCGFATFENVLYVFSYGQSVGLLRMVTAVPGHAFLGIIFGYFLGTAKFSPNGKAVIFKGAALAVLLHGLYDTVVFSQTSWSFLYLLVMVSLGIYFGLRAKKELARHSKVIEFFRKQFCVLKNGDRFGPFLLKDIRNKIAEGQFETDDILEEVASGKQTTIKEIFFKEIGARHVYLTGFPPACQPPAQIILFFVMTLGFYFYFWFHKILRQIRNQKRCRVNPELRVMLLFILTLVPFFLFGRFQQLFASQQEARMAEWSLYFFVSGVEAYFLLGLLQILNRVIRGKIKSPFNLWILVGLFFILSLTAKSLPLGMPGYWITEFAVLGLQGAVLARVQKDLNHFWELERDLWEKKTNA